jgi:hypothetical protein
MCSTGKRPGRSLISAENRENWPKNPKNKVVISSLDIVAKGVIREPSMAPKN